uniref:Uncharacterized protein n=1 Tax=Aliivibrio wodanis TaxID=80852 RepID=A0A5Q4Z4E2_9GAMM|nr:hypothetical protein AW0309160_01850 [Aliivibrio wodanis]
MKVSRLHAIIIVGTITMYSFSNAAPKVVSFIKCQELKYESVQYIVKPGSAEELRINKALDKCSK